MGYLLADLIFSDAWMELSKEEQDELFGLAMDSCIKIYTTPQFAAN